MSSQTQQPSHNAQRGRRGNNRGRGGQSRSSKPTESQGTVAVQPRAIESTPALDEEDHSSEDVCFICAEQARYWAVSRCNHRTCHVCALRLRALYKRSECTFCKDPQVSVIFTVSPDALYTSYAPGDIAFKDAKLSIFFETQEMMEETLILLRFNCPDPDCPYIASGWGDLKLHVRSLHGKAMCDLCIRSKKVFSHEHALYPPHLLPLHLPSMPHRAQKNPPKEPIEGGTHPICEFCRECFFSDDELFAHMRERHEECFLCKRNEVRDQYFKDWHSLEAHFTSAHYACTQPACMAQKFVVFNSDMDLKGHMVEEHGGDMTSRDKRDARRIQADFEFDEVPGSGRRDQRQQQQQQHQPVRRAESSSQAAVQQPARPVASGNRRRDAFSGNLTTETVTPQSRSQVPSRRASPSPTRGDLDPVVAARHSAFLARLQTLAPNGMTAVRAAIRGYRLSETSARDVISTVWNILDRNLDDTAGVIVALVDLLDEDDKKNDLLGAWNGFKVEQRGKFPELVTSSVGNGYAGIAGGTVLNAKHVTTTRKSRRGGGSSQVWDRVAEAASSTAGASSSRPAAAAGPSAPPVERFPALAPPDRFPSLQPSSKPAQQPQFRPAPGGQRNTPWAGSARPPTSAKAFPGPPSVSYAPSLPVPAQTGFANSVAGPSIIRSESRPAPTKSNGAGVGPPKLSSAGFPGLPTSNNTRTKATVSGNVSLRNIVGVSAPPMAAWKAGGGGAASNGDADAAASREEPVADVPAAKGKKGKGKQKQTLFTLGSFPT